MVRHALVLAQVLGPGLDLEPLDQGVVRRGILHHAPGVGAIAAALGRQPGQRLQEGGLLGMLHVVGDLYHHRPPVVVHFGLCQRLGPVVGRNKIRLPLRQLDAVRNQAHHDESGRTGQQGVGHADGLGRKAPGQAAQSHGTVEDRQIHRQCAATHPVGQDGLCHAIERGQRRDPGGAQQQQGDRCRPLRRTGGQKRHDCRGDTGRQQQQAVGRELGAQLGQQERAADGPHTDRPQQDAVKACAAAQQLARHQGQQGPDRAGQRKEQECAQQHDVQLAAGAGIAQPRAEGTRKALGQIVLPGLGARPPQQSGHHEHIADDIHAIGDGSAQARQHHAPQRRAHGARDVDAQRVQCDRRFQVFLPHQLRHDGLPGRPHQRRANAAQKRERHQREHGLHAQRGQGHQRNADAGQQQLDADQKLAAVQNVRQHTGRNRQQERRGRRGRLHQCHGRGRWRQVGHDPRAGHIAHKAAGVANDGGHPQHGKQLLPQRCKAAVTGRRRSGAGRNGSVHGCVCRGSPVGGTMPPARPECG